ncbi:mitogen-activated protein kinase 7-like [Ylistrum balloti]|uniref:mitogen-activated protein kinase 7-like n=1 Tax=Ylistrum balloti TaxID=509963 RepID=UPI0029057E49|nr:mitogen-activated protein kinase 7-like [Ylistrum balloti]
MASLRPNDHENLMKKLAIVQKKSLDVKFDLTDTDYQAVENIGIGAYGVVCSAIHRKTQDRVAIKKIPRIFDYCKIGTTTYREIKILKHFKHDNIISIRDIIKPKESMAEFRDIYVVFDLMESDLHKIIYSKQDLSEEHVRYFLYQLLRGLKYIHSANVIHRDLKPSNLLVNEDCQLKIGDFGMARGVSASPEEPNHFMTQYVATRWYRAPEIMLALVEYGAAVDVWSVGCIFAEMLGRKHLFPGKDYISQIKLIVGILGSPSDGLFQLCQSDLIKQFITKLGKKESIAWNSLFPKASKKALDLLGKMLVLHPGDRISVDNALNHPYLNKYHDPDDEPICLPTFNFDFENEEMTTTKLRNIIYKEIMDYHEPKSSVMKFSACLKPVPRESTCTISTPPKQESSTSQSSIDQKPVLDGLQVVPQIQLKEEFKQLTIKNSEERVTLDKDSMKIPTNDVEMPSAKSEGGEAQSAAPVSRIKEEVQQEIKKENKTISSDTKALVKAALLNSSLKKQRHESAADGDDRPKPITAAQRQKEREEKRRKKKEKALERTKKKKEQKAATDAGGFLTDADRELLNRWSKMQKVNHPIAPKPDNKSNPTPQPANCNMISIGETGQTLGQQCLQQYLANQKKAAEARAYDSDPSQPQINPSGTVHQGSHRTESNISQPGHSGQHQPGITQSANFPQDSSQKNCQAVNTTMSGLQAAQNIISTKVGNSHGDVSSNKQNNMSYTQQLSLIAGSHSGQGIMGNLVQQQDIMEGGVHKSEGNNINNDLSTISFENLKMLGIINSQTANTNLQHGHFFNTPQQSLSFSTSGGENAPSATATSLLQDENQNQAFSQVRGPVSHGSPASPHKEYSNHSSPESYQSHGSPEYYQGETQDQSNKHLGSYSEPSPDLQQRSPQQGFQQGAHDSVFQQRSPPSTFDQQQSPQSLFQQQNSPQSTFDEFGRRPSDDQLSNADSQSSNPGLSDAILSMNTVQDLSGHINQMPFAHGHYFAGSSQIPFKQDATAQSQPTQPNQPYFTSGSSMHPGQSLTNHLVFNANSPPGLIASLSRQFSRSQVDDPCPPALALTPRGTGAGYGVGMDLDALMVDAQEIGARPEPSPLSSSLLTDWMEVTSDLNIDMDALEQELSLQSPMTLSYNDLSMYTT